MNTNIAVVRNSLLMLLLVLNFTYFTFEYFDVDSVIFTSIVFSAALVFCYLIKDYFKTSIFELSFVIVYGGLIAYFSFAYNYGESGQMIFHYISWSVLLTCFIRAFAIGLAEEYLFRKLLIDGLSKIISTPWAILISTGLFTVLHSRQFIEVFYIGLVAALIYVKFNSLTANVIFHTGVDFLAFFSFYVDDNPVHNAKGEHLLNVVSVVATLSSYSYVFYSLVILLLAAIIPRIHLARYRFRMK